MTRKRRSTRDRVKLFEQHQGMCHICDCPIHAGQRWEWSHPRPLALGGEDTWENAAPAHFKCHRDWTASEDIPRIARAKAQRASHIGAKAPSNRPIKSRGFVKKPKRGRIELTPLPKPNLYTEAP